MPTNTRQQGNLERSPRQFGRADGALSDVQRSDGRPESNSREDYQTRAIPWRDVVRFHREVTRRAEEEYFALPCGFADSERWTSLSDVEPEGLAGPWRVPKDAVVSSAFHRAIQSGIGETFLGGPCWFRWRKDSGKWRLDWLPLLYREVRMESDDDGAVSIIPMQGNWEISPLVFDFLEMRNVQTAAPLDEMLADLLERAQTMQSSGERDMAAAIREVILLVAPELGEELVKACNQFPGDRVESVPSPWVLFSAPTGGSQITQHIMRDYELLERHLEQNSEDIGGLRLLEDLPTFTAGKEPDVLPIVPLNASQKKAVAGVLQSRPITVVSGPPGCGKSQVVLSILLNAWAKNVSVLFASNNNQAVDVIRERLQAYESDFPIAIRAGARRYNNVEESLRRSLNIVSSGGNGIEPEKRSVKSKRGRLLKRKQRLQDLLDSQLPQQIDQAVGSAVKAYATYRDVLEECLATQNNLQAALEKLAFSAEPRAFERETLEPLRAWRAQRVDVRLLIEGDDRERTRFRRLMAETVAIRDQALESQGFSSTGPEALGWLRSGPGPELLQAWQDRFGQTLAKPVEQYLEAIPWKNAFGKWSSETAARQWAEGADRLATDCRKLVMGFRDSFAEINVVRDDHTREQKLLNESIGSQDVVVPEITLDAWASKYAQLCSLQRTRFDGLPWSQRNTLIRTLERLENELRKSLPLAVWTSIGVMNDQGRIALGDVLEQVRRWLDTKARWEELSNRRAAIEERIKSLRAQTESLRLADIPESRDLRIWSKVAKKLVQQVQIAREAADAWRRKETEQTTRNELRDLAATFRSTASGVPLKEAWTNGVGKEFAEGVARLGISQEPDEIARVRALLYQDTLAAFVRAWKCARDAETEVVKLEVQLEAVPARDMRIRDWNSEKPVFLTDPNDYADAFDDNDHPVWCRLTESEKWWAAWRNFIEKHEPELQRRISEERSWALEKLNEASLIIPEGDDRDWVSQLRDALSADPSKAWPTDELTQRGAAYRPERIQAEIEGLDAQLERISLELAQQAWTERIVDNVQVQKRLEFLQNHYRRNRGRINEAGYEGFAEVLDAQPIWITVAMSAQAIPMLPEIFDLLIIDEATQCPVTNMLPLIFRAKRVVVIGDPEQLTAINSLGIEAEKTLASKFGVEEWMELLGHTDNDVYKVAVRGLPRRHGDVISLTEHYRSHPQIIGFSNQHIYRKALSLRKSPIGSKSVPHGSGVHAIPVRGECTRGERNRSWKNNAEAQAVCDLITRLRAAEGHVHFSIGVVTPFRAQKQHIAETLERQGLLKGVTVDTVHRYQGDERDVMIFSPVVARGMSESTARWIETPKNLVNVAVTRARESLFFVADFDACRSQPGILGKLTSYVETVAELRNTSHAELELFTWMITQGWSPDVHVQVGDIEVDFVLVNAGIRLAVEVDGEQHHRHPTSRDDPRDAFLQAAGYRILRVMAREVNEAPALVLRKIAEALEHDQTELRI